MRRLPAWRQPLAQRGEELETARPEVAREPAAREQLPALDRHRGRLERLHDAGQRRLARPARLGEEPLGRLPQTGQRLALAPSRLVEALSTFTGEKTLLGLAQPMAGVEK